MYVKMKYIFVIPVTDQFIPVTPLEDLIPQSSHPAFKESIGTLQINHISVEAVMFFLKGRSV
jgi:hypothetical protein